MFFIFFCIYPLLEVHFLPSDSLWLKFNALFEQKETATVEQIETIYRKIHFYELKRIYSGKSFSTLFVPVPEDVLPDSGMFSIASSFSDYCNPLKGVITSAFGRRGGRMHKGIDIHLRRGDPVLAVADGTVRFAGRCGGWGNVVVIDHGMGIETLYAHLSQILVKEGDMVLSEQPIGKGGNTGRSRGAHLHFELRFFGHPVNPLYLIKFDQSFLYSTSIKFLNSNGKVVLFPAEAKIYYTKKGDTWKKIARSGNKNIRELYTLNGIIRPDYLKPGSWIRLE